MLAALQVVAIVELAGIQTFVTEFTFDEEVTVDCEFHSQGISSAVITVFRIPPSAKHVAVLTVGKILRVLAVFTPHSIVVHNHNVRHSVIHFEELFDERPRGVVDLSELQWIPLVAPPATNAVDREGHIIRIDGNDVSIAFTACSRME